MPQVASTGPRDPNNTSPGNAYNSNQSGIAKVPQLVQNPTITSQVFEITCTGMKPNTVHKFYYEGQDLGAKCVPVSPKPPGTAPVQNGAPLITDASGKIVFKFHFTVAVEKQVDAANKTTYELAGDKKFTLEAVNSSASKVVPYARHKKVSTATGKFQTPFPVGPTGNQH